MLRTTAILALAAAALIAGCGSSSPTSTDTTGGSSNSFSSLVARAYRFSSCMRSHGVPNFPDPHVINKPGEQGIGITAVSGQAPAAKAASQACAKYAPVAGSSNGPDGGRPQAQIKAEFALARCLRAHGFPKFPDPDNQGQITPQQFSGSGIDLSQPGFLSAATNCLPATHGVITVAMLKNAIAHMAAQTSPTGG